MDIDLSAGSLVAGMLVSTVGLGLFLYGKKQTRMPQFLVGLVLMIYPVFVPGPVPMLAIGAVCVAGLWVALRAGA